ncbi:MAG: undecaprenyl-diphosphate phosphatase, partial [Candidatus Sedimenticola sp. 20ELBAFRAG]
LVQGEFRSIGVIATTTVLFGLLLLWADIKGPKRRDEYSVNLKDALIIGGMQILSLIPGTSRSGITITAGMMLGMTRQGASRFSFLLSIPTILMSGSMVSLKLLQSPLQVDWYALLLGAVLSFAAAFLCIHFFLRLIQRYSMTPFVIYRLFLGGILFGLII